MKEFETSAYLTAKRDINDMIDNVNSILKNLDKTLLKVIDGKTLHELDMADIPQILKNEKVKNIPSFTEMLAVGVDIRNQVVLSDKETEDINSLNEIIDSYGQSNVIGHSGLLQLATVIKGKAVINEFGIRHMEGLKIRMNTAELELYNKILELRDLIVSKDKFLLYSLFKIDVFNSMNQTTDFTPQTFKSVIFKHNLDKK